MMRKIKKTLFFPILISLSLLMNTAAYAYVDACNQFVSSDASDVDRLRDGLAAALIPALAQERFEEIIRLYKGGTVDEKNIMNAFFIWTSDWITSSDRRYYLDDTLAYLSGDCQGKAQVYRKLVTHFGLECVMIGDDEINHAWNAVKANGKWYYLDCGWDVPPCSETEFKNRHGLMKDGKGTDSSKWKVVFDDNGNFDPVTTETATDQDDIPSPDEHWEDYWKDIYDNNFYGDEKFIYQDPDNGYKLTFNPEYNTADWKVHDAQKIESMNGIIAYSNRIELIVVWEPHPGADCVYFKSIKTWDLNDSTRYIDHVSGEDGIVTYTTCLKDPYGTDPKTGTIDWSEYNGYEPPKNDTGENEPPKNDTGENETPKNGSEDPKKTDSYNTRTITATYGDYTATVSMDASIPFCKSKKLVRHTLNVRVETTRKSGGVDEPCDFSVKKITATKPKNGSSKITIKLKAPKSSSKEDRKAAKMLSKQLKKIEVEILPEGYTPVATVR